MASEPLSDFVARLPQERRAEANYLRKRLKSLGDRVGPNDMRLSEALWQASEVVRAGLNDGSGAYGAQAYLAEHADAAIRSLRVKLFKERAMTHALNAEYFETRRNHKRAARHRRAHSRFAILAELIRAGKR